MCENEGKISCITSNGVKTFTPNLSYTTSISETDVLHVCSFRDYIGITIIEAPIFKIYKNGDLIVSEELNDVYDFNHITMFESPYKDHIMIVLARNNNTLLYYSFKDEKINLEQTISTGNFWGMNIISVDKTRKLMAVGCDDACTLLFSLDPLEGYKFKKSYNGGGYGVSFNSNSSLLACSNKRSILIYDLSTDSSIFNSKSNSYLVPKFSPTIPDMFLIWDHNGLFVYSIERNKDYNLIQTHKILNYRLFRFDTFSLCFSNDGKKVFCGDNEFILEFNLVNRSILKNLYQNLEKEVFCDVIIN